MSLEVETERKQTVTIRPERGNAASSYEAKGAEREAAPTTGVLVAEYWWYRRRPSYQKLSPLWIGSKAQSMALSMSVPPRIIYGTAWKKERTAALVHLALRSGFRAIDTACQPKHYHEPGVGDGLQLFYAEGHTRDEVYLQSKFTPLSGQDPAQLPYDEHAALELQIEQSLSTSLSNLKTARLDCLVLHSPLATLQETARAWKAMEHAVENGTVTRLGISNCYDPEFFRSLTARMTIPPAVLQNRFYADTGYDSELRKSCAEHGVVYQSFWTLTANPNVLRHPTTQRLSSKYRVTVEQLFLRCLTQSGIVPLVGTTSREHMMQDVAIFNFEVEEPDYLEVMSLVTP